MSQSTLERVVEEAKTLTAQEQRRLRGMLDDWLARESDTDVEEMEAKERLLTQRLLKKGIVSKIPSGERLQQRFRPVVVQGEPVSETILKERR